MPKIFSDDLRLRAVALLLEFKNAETAAAQVMREYPGTKITGATIRGWGKGLKVKLLRGGKPGHQGATGPRQKRSEHRDAAMDLIARGISQAEVARRLGITRQLVHYFVHNKNGDEK